MSLPICEKCQSKKKCCQYYHLLYEDKTQIVKEITNTLPIDEEGDNMSSDGLGLSPTSSRANIGLSQISVPLAWKSKETRTFSMFIVLQTRTRVIDTKIITHVDRNMTDVIINDSFIFDNEPEDFCVDILIYAARTDYGLENSMSSGSLRSRISRSLGRKFGASVKAHASHAEPKKSPRFDQAVGGAHYNLLAKASLLITDASEEATIHNLRMSAFADLSGPPLYGHVICRMAVQPHSVLRPIAEGVLSVNHVNEDLKLDNVFTRLQGGHLQFFTVGDISFSSMETVLVVPLNRRSRVMATTQHPLMLLLKTDATSDVPASTVYLEANNQKAYETWRRALELQIYDIGVWGKFATSSTNLLYKKREDPVRETLSRAAGSNLYETISIKGSISKANFGGLSLVPCEGVKNGIAATAPAKRPNVKQRANVIDLFQSPKAARKEEEPSNYVIQLNIGDDSVENEYSAYSPLSRPSSRHNRQYEEIKDGRRSWSKSIGSFIGRSSTASSQITRL